jgi:DNA polymerase III subunit delta'
MWRLKLERTNGSARKFVGKVFGAAMVWLGIEGHDGVVEKFRQALRRGRLANTFLFVGTEGIGKRTFAIRLAQALLCEKRDAAELNPCGECPGCAQVLAGTHPDLILVQRPPGKSEIPVGLLKGDDHYPVEQSLLCQLSLKPFHGGRKVAILDDADDLNPAGANCMLKTLEEPPPSSILILIGTSLERQLPTIRSRAQIVRFAKLSREIIERLLIERKVVSDLTEAKQAAELAGGSFTQAVALADAAIWSFRGKYLARLSQLPRDGLVLAREISVFLEEAGKEAAVRRERLRMVVGWAADFFRLTVRAMSGIEAVEEAELGNAVGRAIDTGWDAESAAEASQRCLTALAEIDRNANQSTLVEAWIDDLILLKRQCIS